MSKIFDEFPTVDCNNCDNYWNNSCDSPKTLIKGSTTLCNSFLATRSVVIPHQVKKLNKAIRKFAIAMCVFGVVSVVSLVLVLMLIFEIF